MDYNPVGWFEIPVTEMDRAVKFYEAVFGYTLEVHEMGPNIMAWFPQSPEFKGAAGTLIKGPAYIPSAEGSLVYFTAPDLEGHVARITEAGGSVIQGKMSIGEYGFIALAMDTEGNRIALHSAQG